ncbi:MAG TPA: hypothetical protein VGA19_07905 [Rhodospirillales bacterium]
MQIQATHPAVAARSVPSVPSRWATADRIGSYLLAAFIILGGVCTPLGLAVYSLLFRSF